MSERIDVPALPRPWSDGRARAVDVALTTVLLLPVLVLAFTKADRSATLLSFIEIVPLLVRRVQPAACFYTVTAASALQLALLDHPIWGQVALPIAVYAVAAYENRATARVALVASLVAGVLGPVDWVVGDGQPAQTLFLWFSTSILVLLAPWALGSMVKAERAYAAEVTARAEQLEREAALKADLAEARRALDGEEQDTIDTGADTGAVPQPGLDDVPSLVEHARESGVRLTADLAERLSQVPAGTGLTAYRIVQEALVNVRKHAGPAADVHVSVRQIGNDLVVEVVDDGLGADAGLAQLHGAGRGLAGMHERVSVHGGYLEAGPRPGGGFAVRARLPLPAYEPRA
jgi:signal transduction histidine kinase